MCEKNDAHSIENMAPTTQLATLEQTRPDTCGLLVAAVDGAPVLDLRRHTSANHTPHRTDLIHTRSQPKGADTSN